MEMQTIYGGILVLYFVYFYHRVLCSCGDLTYNERQQTNCYDSILNTTINDSFFLFKIIF